MKEIAGIRIPDSAVVTKAIDLARAVSQPVVFNHVMRTYAFGALVAQRHGMAYDEEVACLGAVLHDLGLTGHAAGPKRFEVEGADAARRFVVDRGFDEARAGMVWEAIALHTSVGIASERPMEIALTHIGASIDVLGLGLEAITPAALEAVLDAWPRLRFKEDFFAVLVATFTAKPQTMAFTWAADICRDHVHGFACPSFRHVMADAAFPE